MKKKLINKKEGNVLIPNQGIWKARSESVSAQMSQFGVHSSEGNVIPLPENGTQDTSITETSMSSLVMNYGAVACLMLVMGGTLYFNQGEQFGDRGLASAQPDRQLQRQVLEDLNSGRRVLASVGSSHPSDQKKALLDRKRDFRKTLRSYRIRFNDQGKVQSMRLRSSRAPLALSDIHGWIREHRFFFPNLSFSHQQLEESFQVFVFKRDKDLLHFKLNEKHELISINTLGEK